MQSLYSVAGDKIDVVYNGIDLTQSAGDRDGRSLRGELGISHDAPLVLFVGRMVYQKGPDLLLWAVPKVLQRFPTIRFVFAGEGDMRSTVAAQAQGMGLSHIVSFLGDVAPGRIHTLYDTSNVVCVPSRNEPFGLVVLEAWRASKPVVTTDQGGPGEIVWHGVTGNKVPAEPDALANAIGDILADEARAQWMGRNGRIAVEESFSWDFAAEEVLATYHSV
jgi:glycosyltransferase involved in cell wall biosynthesis